MDPSGRGNLTSWWRALAAAMITKVLFDWLYDSEINLWNLSSWLLLASGATLMSIIASSKK